MTVDERVSRLEFLLTSYRRVLGTVCVVTGVTTLQKLKLLEPDIYDEVKFMVVGFNDLQMHHMAEAPGISDYHKKPNADGSPRT